MFNSYARYYDLFNQDKPYRKEIEFVFKWADKPKSIFDIGAGTGSYWKYYPKETVLVGVDKSRGMAHHSKDIAYADITTYKHGKERFDCATALFDVINYIPRHDWWKSIPVKKGGYFIFDIWDKEKVLADGFKETLKRIDGIIRKITPVKFDGQQVDLDIKIINGKKEFSERHKMYVYSQKKKQKN